MANTFCQQTSSYRTSISALEDEHLDGQLGRRANTSRGSTVWQVSSFAWLDSKRANCFFGFILGANLLMSIANTLLLAFVIKSAQLNQVGGAFGGKLLLNVGEERGGASLELAAELEGGRRLLAKSIESADGPALAIESLRRSGSSKQTSGDGQILIGSTAAAANKQSDYNSQVSSSSYLLVDGDAQRAVELETRVFALGHLQSDAAEQHYHLRQQQEASRSADKLIKWRRRRPNELLEFDGAQQSITFNSLAKLEDGRHLEAPNSNSLALERQLIARELSGTLATSFE